MVITTVLFLACSVTAFAVEQGVDISQKVYDYAGLFTAEQVQLLKDRCLSLSDSTKNDVVILTIDNNDRADTLTYAEDFYDYNGFGIGETHNGILLIIDMDNRKLQTLTTGKGDDSSAYVVIDPERLSHMEDNIFNYVAASDYYGGATVFLEDTALYFQQGSDTNFWYQYNNDSDFRNNYDLDQSALTYPQRFLQKLGFGAIGGILLTAIVVTVLCKKNRELVLAKNAASYAVFNSLQLTHSEDRFVSTKTTVTPIAQDTTRTGGGGGGFHTGSSGTSHGTGGGRSF